MERCYECEECGCGCVGNYSAHDGLCNDCFYSYHCKECEEPLDENELHLGICKACRSQE